MQGICSSFPDGTIHQEKELPFVDLCVQPHAWLPRDCWTAQKWTPCLPLPCVISTCPTCCSARTTPSPQVGLTPSSHHIAWGRRSGARRSQLSPQIWGFFTEPLRPQHPQIKVPTTQSWHSAAWTAQEKNDFQILPAMSPADSSPEESCCPSLSKEHPMLGLHGVPRDEAMTC